MRENLLIWVIIVSQLAGIIVQVILYVKNRTLMKNLLNLQNFTNDTLRRMRLKDEIRQRREIKVPEIDIMKPSEEKRANVIPSEQEYKNQKTEESAGTENIHNTIMDKPVENATIDEAAVCDMLAELFGL